MEEAAILLENYLNSLIRDITITQKTDLGNGSWRLTCNAPKTIVENDKVTVGTTDYRVTGSGFKTYIDIKADSEPTADIVKRTLTVYIGNHLETSKIREADRKPDQHLKYPFAVIFEPIKNELRSKEEDNSPAGKVSKAKLVLMDEFLISWTQAEHYDYAVKPMVRIMTLLKEKMDNSGDVNDILKFDYENRIRWTLFAKFPHIKSGTQIFKDNLSGVEFEIDFEITNSVNIIGCLH